MLLTQGYMVEIFRGTWVIMAGQLYRKQSSNNFLSEGGITHLWKSCISNTIQYIPRNMHTVFALLCFVVVIYTLTDCPISIRLTSLALWQSNDCPSASKATLMNMDKYFMWIHYERLQNHNKAKHNKTVCIFLRIYCNALLWKQWQPYTSSTYPPPAYLGIR